MTKLKRLTGIAVMSILLSSCSVIFVAVTDNPVGNKEGVAKGLKEANMANAAKNGGIKEIGTVKYQWRGAKSVVTVTGN